jgi:hypothetical protein
LSVNARPSAAVRAAGECVNTCGDRVQNQHNTEELFV